MSLGGEEIRCHHRPVTIVIGPLEGDVARYDFLHLMGDAELERALEDMGAILERAAAARRKVGFLAVSTSESRMTSKQRNRAASWVKEHDALMTAACAGMSIVVPGAIQRGAFTAILWLVDYPAPIRAFGALPEAEAWIRSIVRSETSFAPNL